MPSVSEEGDEHGAALDFIRAVVYRFGTNAKNSFICAGATEHPQQEVKITVEIPDVEIDAWRDAPIQYVQENMQYQALDRLAFEWEAVLASYVREGNWQPYGFSVSIEELETDMLQYQEIQSKGILFEMRKILNDLLQRFSDDQDMRQEYQSIANELQRVFGSEG